MRLVQGGLALGYNQSISYQGPYPVKVSISQEEPYNYTQVEVEYTMALEQRWLDGFEVWDNKIETKIQQHLFWLLAEGALILKQAKGKYVIERFYLLKKNGCFQCQK